MFIYKSLLLQFYINGNKESVVQWSRRKLPNLKVAGSSLPVGIYFLFITVPYMGFRSREGWWFGPTCGAKLSTCHFAVINFTELIA
jgi:hypothetical protein